MKGPTATRARHAAPAKRDAGEKDRAEKERERLGQIVHDLNSPLSAVSLQLFLRRKSLAKPTPQDLHFLEILDRNVERIRTLVASVMPEGARPTPTTQPAPQATQPSRPRRRARTTW